MATFVGRNSTYHHNIYRPQESGVLMSARVLNHRQARWSMSLSRFDFIITYWPDSLRRKPDALSRRSYLAPKPGDEVLDQQKTVLLKVRNLQLKAATIAEAFHLDEIWRALMNDAFASNMRKCLKNKRDLLDIDEDFEFQDGLLYYKRLLYLPQGPLPLKILQARHDFLAAGYFGFNKTIELVARDYWWPQMWKYVKDFVRSCDTCAKAKAPRHQPHGLLHPLPIPKGP